MTAENKRFEIKSRRDGAVLYTTITKSLKRALECACRAGIRLDGADLDGLDLNEAYGHGASFKKASFKGTSLTGAYIERSAFNGACLDRALLNAADFYGTDFEGASLVGSSLVQAKLVEANFSGADLRGADFEGAYLFGAKFDSAAQLEQANLSRIKADFWEILNAAPAEVMGLLFALRAGNINGTAYVGECACLIGTLANLRGVRYDSFPGIVPDSGRPAERWFLALRKGHTPTTSPIALITETWIDEWMALRAKKVAMANTHTVG